MELQERTSKVKRLLRQVTSGVFLVIPGNMFVQNNFGSIKQIKQDISIYDYISFYLLNSQ